MKKFLALVLALIMALSLVACGNQQAADPGADENGVVEGSNKSASGETDKDVYIDFWGVWANDNYRAMFWQEKAAEFCEKYEAETGISVEIEYVGQGGSYAQLSEKLAAGGVSQTLPVISQVEEQATARFYPLAVDLTQYLSEDVMNNYLDGLMVSCTQNGTKVAVPAGRSYIVTCVNKDLLEAQFVARRIQSLLCKPHMLTEGDGQRPIRPSDIMILLRSPGSVLHHYVRTLNEAGVPWVAEGGGDIFTTTEVNVALAILQIPPLLQSHPLSLFLAGGLLATLTEYVIALFYDRGIGVQFWDYSHQPGNVAGRICPLYTLLWGFLSLALVYWVNPFLSPYLTALPHRILLIFYPLFAMDSLLTLCLLHRTGSADSLMWYKTLPRFRRRPLPG